MARRRPGKSAAAPPGKALRRSGDSLRAVLLAVLVLTAAAACAAKLPPALEAANYYLTSEIAYLRDTPGYEGNILGQLYKDDRVEQLESNEAGWWRVRSGRTGQTGWVQGELFSPNPVALVYFYVTRTVSLRECAGETCPSLQLLYRGDQVQKVEENDQGWWRVLVARSRTLGWLPAAVVSDHLEKAAAGKPENPYHYVAVKALQLRRQPAPGAKIVKTLRLNDQLLELEVNPTGWVKVRQPATGAEGWVKGRYLKALPVRVAPEVKKPATKKPEKKKEAVPEPEVM
jgi:uncharacterized protein YgiM (DUF1202 family)